MAQIKIISDADGLIALFNPNDIHSNKATLIIEQIRQINAQILYPSTALVEAATTLQRKFNQPKISQIIINAIEKDKFNIIPIDAQILITAGKLYKPTQTSKKHTFFDAIVAAIAKKSKADYIFSFDKWYTKQGLKLTAELL